VDDNLRDVAIALTTEDDVAEILHRLRHVEPDRG
jgi:hypothetical protein